VKQNDGEGVCLNRPPRTRRPPQRRRQAVLAKPDPGQGSRGASFGVEMPSDPRPGIQPRGGNGWAERGDQECEALQDLAFRTGPNNASVLSRLMARGILWWGKTRHGVRNPVHAADVLQAKHEASIQGFRRRCSINEVNLHLESITGVEHVHDVVIGDDPVRHHWHHEIDGLSCAMRLQDRWRCDGLGTHTTEAASHSDAFGEMRTRIFDEACEVLTGLGSRGLDGAKDHRRTTVLATWSLKVDNRSLLSEIRRLVPCDSLLIGSMSYLVSNFGSHPENRRDGGRNRNRGFRFKGQALEALPDIHLRTVEDEVRSAPKRRRRLRGFRRSWTTVTKAIRSSRLHLRDMACARLATFGG
jgi:hypothetical protein